MIRGSLWLLLFVSICLPLTTIYSASAKEIENLVINPDFEDFGTNPWSMWVEDPAALAQMTIDKKEKLTGEQCLVIDITKKGGGMRVELHQNPFVLKQGQKMTYAFWAKVDKDDIRPAVMIVNHRADPWTTYGSKVITITEEWTEFTTSAAITANDNIVGIYVELRDTVGKTWFDHFRFYEGDYVEEELGKEEKQAVDPKNKIASTWATIKAEY